MLRNIKSSVFNSGAKTIVNTINTVGVMGAGLALECALRYPEMEQDYKKKCENKELSVGHVDYYEKDGISIVNFPTKWHFKYPSQMSWIKEGLEDFCRTYKGHGITSIAFPKLGCSRGGLDWSQVKPLMEKYLGNLDIDVYICEDSLDHAEGKEKEMVDAINASNLSELAKSIKLSKKQIENLQRALPVKRFWLLSKVDGIGSKAYRELFNYFYQEKEANYEQLTLF